MTIVIPNRLTDLEIIKQLSDLLNEYNNYKKENRSKNKYSSLDKYLDDKSYDYIREFISITDDSIDEISMNYLINCFYKAKGTLEIFNMMTKYLNVIFRTPPVYTVDKLELDIESLDTVDMTRYKTAMYNFLMTLLYYKDLSVIIHLLNLYISENLYTKSSISRELYKEYELSYENRDI